MKRFSHQERCHGRGPRPIRPKSSRPISIVRRATNSGAIGCAGPEEGKSGVGANAGAGSPFKSVQGFPLVLDADGMN